MPEYLLAFDIGTSGVKAGLFTPAGQMLGDMYREYSVQYPGPQRVEQSVAEMWTAQCRVSRRINRSAWHQPKRNCCCGRFFTTRHLCSIG